MPWQRLNKQDDLGNFTLTWEGIYYNDNSNCKDRVQPIQQLFAPQQQPKVSVQTFHPFHHNLFSSKEGVTLCVLLRQTVEFCVVGDVNCQHVLMRLTLVRAREDSQRWVEQQGLEKSINFHLQ